MQNFKNRIKHTLQNEVGASSLEAIVIISLVIVISTALFFFSDDVMDFMGANVRKASHIGWDN